MLKKRWILRIKRCKNILEYIKVKEMRKKLLILSMKKVYPSKI
jgi:plasmid rolling circle replication initiator protein Rep